MAGNAGHGDVIEFFPGAAKAECDGADGFASITRADGMMTGGRCPLCTQEKLAASVAAFIPPRFAAEIEIPKAVTAWAALGRKAQGLYLAGPVGTGKTHAAWMSVRLWCEHAGMPPASRRPASDGIPARGPAVIFTRMTDLLDDLRPGDDSRQRIRDCQGAELLVIDDLGAEKPSEWTQERFYSVIDERYTRQLPLIVTSNLPPSKLAEQAGERTASRLAEMCEVVVMTGHDRRRSAA